MKIGLIIGNGLSKSFGDHAGAALKSWNTNTPLSWQIPTPGQPSTQLIDHLPHYKIEYNNIRTQNPSISDFDLLDALVQNAKTRSADLAVKEILLDNALVEARHFIVNAFSCYQAEASKVDSSRWRWTDWFTDHRFHLSGAVSFNYDIILEKALFAAGVKYHRFLKNDNHLRFPILKPHGSVDFAFKDVHASEYEGGPPLPHSYPLKIYVEQPSVTATRMSPADMLKPRLVSAVVLPKEISQYRELGWVKPGYEWWHRNAPTFTHVVLVGLSYHPSDRPELNTLLNSVPVSATIHLIAGKSPSEDMICFLRKRFTTIRVGEYTPPELT